MEPAGRPAPPRRVVVEVVERDPADGAVTVAAGFGRAVSLDEEAASAAMLAYARRHPRAAKALSGFMGFRVDGSQADYAAAGRRIPMVRFVDRGSVNGR